MDSAACPLTHTHLLSICSHAISQDSDNMKDTLFVPVVALSTLSAALAIAITACAAQALHTFNLDQPEDIWLLPIWRDHFDIRDLQAFVGAGAFITISSILVLALTLAARVCMPPLFLSISAADCYSELQHNCQRNSIKSGRCRYLDCLDPLQRSRQTQSRARHPTNLDVQLDI